MNLIDIISILIGTKKPELVPIPVNNGEGKK